jgi:RNA polymerase sigma-70 factor (ECF subfamily)
MSKDATRFDVTGHLPALRRYARALTRDETEAEDLVHDAIVRAFEGRATFETGGNLKSWLFSVLHNAFVSGVRSRNARRARHDRASEIAETQYPPEQEPRLRLAQIRSAFLTLPAEQREALHLVAIEGMAYGEAAGVLGVPIGTLMSRLGRARAALRAFEDNQSNIVPLKLVRGRDEQG